MMSRKTAKRIAAVVAFLLAATMVLSVIIEGLQYASASSSVSALQDKLSDIKDRKAEVQHEINSINDKITTINQKKVVLDKQITLTQDEISTTSALVKQLNRQIHAENAALKDAESALQEKQELFCTRLRVMYEEGDSTYLDVLLASTNLEDMMSRIEVVGQIMNYDKGVVKSYTAAKEEIRLKKLSLEQDQSQQLDYQASLQGKFDALAQQRQAQQQLAAGLNVSLKAKQAESDQIDDERNSINDEIEALSRAAAEAARRRHQSSGGSSSSGGSGDTSGDPYSGSFTWPLPGHSNITSPYGYRTHPITGKHTFHAGVDIGAPNGTPIVAAASGTVVRSYMSSSYGNYTVIDHGGGVMTAYAHQSQRLVSVGEHVSAGQTIGLVGSTGNSTGNHLHFEIYKDGSTVNPMSYF